MACPDSGQLVLEGPRPPVVHRPVGHDRLGRLQPQGAEVGQGTGQEARTRDAALVGVLLDVGVAAAVVDGDMDEGEAHRRVAVDLGPGASAAPGPGLAKARQADRVDVDERARAGPLIAAHKWPWARAPAREPVADEDLVDRRAVPTAEKLQLHPPVVGLLARVEDQRLGLGRQRPRTRLRAR